MKAENENQPSDPRVTASQCNVDEEHNRLAERLDD
jgi:hypothetical protein